MAEASGGSRNGNPEPAWTACRPTPGGGSGLTKGEHGNKPYGKTKFPRQRAGRTPPHGRPATLVNSERSPGRPTRMKSNRRFKCTVFRRQAFVLSSPVYAAGAPVSPGRLMPAGYLLFYLRFPPCALAIRASPMVLGCCVGCATKKVSKKVAGNAIPRSRFTSDRKIAHSRGGSLYPYFDTL